MKKSVDTVENSAASRPLLAIRPAHVSMPKAFSTCSDTCAAEALCQAVKVRSQACCRLLMSEHLQISLVTQHAGTSLANHMLEVIATLREKKLDLADAGDLADGQRVDKARNGRMVLRNFVLSVRLPHV